jgi:hypothetical protein
MWVAAALFLAASGIMPAVAAAADDPAAIRALAMRLAAEFGGGPADVQLTVASIAPLPVPFVLPADAHVVGTVVRRPAGTAEYGTYRYTEYRVYLDSPQAPDALVAALASALQPAGYQRKAVSYGQPAGGFAVSAPEYVTLCKDEAAPAVVVRAGRRDGRTEAVVTESIPAADNPQRGGTPCSPRPQIAGDTSPLPKIGSVDGVSVNRRSSTSGYGFSEQTVDVTTALAPAAVMAAWSKQIADDGWSPDGAPAAGDAGAVATFRRTVDGRPRVVVVSLGRIAQGRYLASVRNVGAGEPSTAGTGR